MIDNHLLENSVPFFIGIIGNRYGWVPAPGDVEEKCTTRFPAVSGYLDARLSVTEMEMQFGVLRRKEKIHACFYIKEGDDKAEVDNAEMLKLWVN